MTDEKRVAIALTNTYLEYGDTFEIVPDPWMRDVFAVRVTADDGYEFDLIVNLQNNEIDEVEFLTWPPESVW